MTNNFFYNLSLVLMQIIIFRLINVFNDYEKIYIDAICIKLLIFLANFSKALQLFEKD